LDNLPTVNIRNFELALRKIAQERWNFGNCDLMFEKQFSKLGESACDEIYTSNRKSKQSYGDIGECGEHCVVLHLGTKACASYSNCTQHHLW